ncbi:hypothetical protein HYX16_06765 [Candidatus Woesearchaeota archaeon]|nr:hypothetical protein [Candidatus Woesearchaeota archaeon]
MRLLEYKGKELLKMHGIRVPPSIITDNKSYINLSYHKEKYKEFFFEYKKVIIKAQIIQNNRKKSGFIVESDNYEESLKLIDELYKKKFNENPITTLLIEKRLDVCTEYFLAIIYDTKTRQQTILFSRKGGTDIEELSKRNDLIIKPVSAVSGLRDYEAREIAKMAGFDKSKILQISLFIKKAYECFEKFDCRSLEINPIIETKDGLLYAGDAKVVIDDNSISRQEIFNKETDIEDTSFLNERELEARKIDYNDYRGVAGKSYIDLGGDIAILASGGGASLTSMDALIQAGGRAANYTEYSGNPPREKVKKLTKIALAKKGINGCLVIGGRANFTDIFETLSGFIEGLKEIIPKPDYPILIRRAGPNDKKAFAMIKEFALKEKYNITLYDEATAISKAAEIMVQKVNEYKEKKNGNIN